MEIWQKLAKHENQLQKSPPRQIFDDFGLILGPLASPKAPKIKKKACRKNSQISEAKKTPKNLKKGSKAIGPAECADRGEDYGGGRRHAKTGKIWKKWKTEIEAKDGEKNLEDPARRLARRPGGGGSLRAFRRAGKFGVER